MIGRTSRPQQVLPRIKKKAANDLYTLPETNIAPENGWLEDVFPIGKAYFHGLC